MKWMLIFATVLLLFGATIYAIPKAKEKAQMQKAVELLQAEKAEEAIELFEQVVKKNPRNEAAQMYLVNAKQLDLQQKTFELEQAYRSGNIKHVQTLAKHVRSKYEKDPVVGDLTAKVIYTQTKSQTK